MKNGNGKFVAPLVFVASILSLTSGPGGALSIGAPASYEQIAGDNDEFRLVMLVPHEPLTTDEGKTYPVSGLYPNDGSITPLWQVERLEPPLHVTDDGRYLAYVGGNAYERSTIAVKFYDRGKLIRELKIDDFLSPGEDPRPGMAGFVWNLEVAFDRKRGLLRITTLKGERRLFSMATGERVEAP